MISLNRNGKILAFGISLSLIGFCALAYRLSNRDYSGIPPTATSNPMDAMLADAQTQVNSPNYETPLPVTPSPITVGDIACALNEAVISEYFGTPIHTHEIEELDGGIAYIVMNTNAAIIETHDGRTWELLPDVTIGKVTLNEGQYVNDVPFNGYMVITDHLTSDVTTLPCN